MFLVFAATIVDGLIEHPGTPTRHILTPRTWSLKSRGFSRIEDFAVTASVASRPELPEVIAAMLPTLAMKSEPEVIARLKEVVTNGRNA